MRIIAGSARGTKLETLPGENTRPTSERAKEAVFSMLQFELVGRRVLDLFAGSGQLALEALSRGASDAVPKTDICPMEKATRGCKTPSEALEAVEKKLKELGVIEH